MLFATTRNNQKFYPAEKALAEGRSPDGGFYIPKQEPVFSGEMLTELSGMTFNQRLAESMNLLLETKLTGWDVDFAIGRKAVRLVSLRHQIIIGEFWHNPDWHFRKLELGLARLVNKNTDYPGSWLRIAIRIAILASVCTDPQYKSSSGMDVAMVNGELLWSVSACYGRKWGLPITSVVMCCNENKNIWELICYGQLRTDSPVIETQIPAADVPVPEELERLIHLYGGIGEVRQYLLCRHNGSVYYMEPATILSLQKGNFVSAVSTNRMYDTIPGVLGTHEYILSPATSLAYSGLLDFRAKKGGLRPALVISEDSPGCNAQLVADILGIGEQAFTDQL